MVSQFSIGKEVIIERGVDRTLNKQACRFHWATSSLVNPWSSERDLSRTLRKHYQRIHEKKVNRISEIRETAEADFLRHGQRHRVLRHEGSNCAPVFPTVSLQKPKLLAGGSFDNTSAYM